MYKNKIEWYIDKVVRRELENLEQGRFTGNIEFKINIKDGGIANINVSLNKSVKKPSEGGI